MPEPEQDFAYEFIKRLVLAWDPDYTKVTPEEAADIAQAQEELERGETVCLEEIEREFMPIRNQGTLGAIPTEGGDAA